MYENLAILTAPLVAALATKISASEAKTDA
jgi:hypothetical protein